MLGILGKVVVTDALGKDGGHCAVIDVHPTGICIHTLINCDPDGRNKFKLGKNVFNDVHSIVFVGQVVLFVPFDPVAPCAPCEPDTNNDGLATAAASHSANVLSVPSTPLAGVFFTTGANEEVNAVIEASEGKLAVTTVTANAIL